MKSLNEDIKTNTYKPVYLFYGEEDYLKKQYRDKMRRRIISPDDTVNYNYFEGKSADSKEIISLANTMPFFAEKRLVIAENTGFFKTSNDELAEFITNIPDTVCIIFIEKDIDKRGKLYKAVSKVGRIVEMAIQDDKTIMYWIAAQVKAEGKRIKEKTARYFIEKAGRDMNTLGQELEKLFSYTIDKEEITTEDIDSIVTTHIQNNIFDMVEAVSSGNQKKALNLYDDLLVLKEPPMRILFLLGRQFKILYEVKQMHKRGYDKTQIAKKIGLHPYVAGKYMAQCRGFKSARLREAMEDAVVVEQKVKTGNLQDVMSVELFIVKYSS
ncbi:MAG: DNA polymerase III subunit delta [Suipraeoptans sp.]